MLLIKSIATKIPKKNDAIKLTIAVFWILKPILFLKLSCINILNIKPKVLPSKMILTDLKFKI